MKGGACSTHVRDEKCIQNFVRKAQGKRWLRWPRRRWEDKDRIDRKKVGWEGVELIHLAEDRDQWRVLVDMVMKLRVP
jgi:hypothetical protein